MNFNELANSEIDLITSEAEKNAAQSKLDLLQQRTEEKVNRLNKEPVGGLAGLTGDAFKQQLSAFAQMDQNTLSSEDLQYALGYATTNPIQKDEEGRRFKLQEDSQGNFIEDANGQNIREYVSDEWTPGRNVYIDNTVDNNMKLGLAAEDKGFMGRYTPDWKQYVPFMDGYGWAPGEKGVTPKDGALMDTTLDYDLATNLEKVIHSNRGQIKNRAIGEGPITQSAMTDFGSGKTEYTTQNAPLWNINYKDDGSALKEGTPLPKPVYEKGSLEEFLYKHSRPEEVDNSVIGRTVNMAKLATATPARFIWDTADAAVEIAGKLVGDTARLVDKKSTLGDNWDLGTGEARRKATYEAFGYDSKLSDQNVKEIHDKLNVLATTEIADEEVGIVDETLAAIAKKTESVPGLNIVTGALNVLNKIASNMSMQDTKDIVGTALSNPETAVESFAELMTVLLGNKGGGAATKLGKLQQKVKASDTLTDVQKTAKLKQLDNAATATQKFNSVVGNNVGLITQSAYITNNSLDDFEKENKRPARYEEIIPALLGNALLLKIDNGIELGILKNSKTIVKEVIEGLPSLPKSGKLQLIAKLAKHATELGYAGAKEVLIEIPQEAFEATGKYNLVGDGAITGEDLQKAINDISVSGATGGALGFSGGVHMKIPSTAKEIISPIVQYADEKLKYEMGNFANKDQTVKPIGMDGKFNMWDSVGTTGFEVTDPKAKEVYAETVAEFAVDLHTNPEAMVKYGYRGREEEGGKNVGNILQDATDKMAKLYNLDTAEAQDVAKYMLVQKLVNYTRSKETAKGTYKIDPTAQQELLKETAEFIKGNKLAEIAFLDMQEDELKAAFDSQVDIKKANEYLNTYGLDQVANGDIIAKLMTLDDEQYGNLQKAVKSMKLMGSSGSVILERMSEIDTELDALRAETKMLGSQDRGPTDGPSGPAKEKIKKTYLDVANEIKKIGFLTRTGLKKSAEQHGRDIENFVGVQGIPESVQTRHVDQLVEFVKHRDIDKVWPFTVVKGEKILNNLPGIKNILSNKIDENEDLIKIMESKIQVLENSKEHPELLARFEKMRDDMYANQGRHAEILLKANSEDPAIRREVYMDLNDTSTRLGKDVLNEMLNEPGRHWDSVPSYENVDTTNTEMDIDDGPISTVADKIEQGKTLTDEDLQVQANEGKALETELLKRAETKVPTGADEGKNEYKDVVKGDTTSGPYKPTVEVDMKTRKEELKEVTKARTYAEWLDKQLDKALSDMQNMKAKHKVLKGLQREYLQDIKKAKTDLHEAYKKIYSVEVLKDRLEKAPDNVYVRGMNRFKDGMKQLKAVIKALKSAITKYYKKIAKLADAEEVTATELGALEAQMNTLAKKIGAIKKEQKAEVTREARTIRAGMEEVLGNLVKPNNKLENSLSALISKDAEIDEIMRLMPNIISKNENGTQMVKDALENLQEFAAMRVTPGDEMFAHKWFPVQEVGKDGYVNPLVEFTMGDKVVSFANLWKLEADKENSNQEYKKYKNEIRAHVKEAMNVASVVVLKDMIDVRLNNSEQMNDTVDDGFGPIWNNLNEDSVVPQKAKVKRDIKAGKYVPEAVFRENAGRFMMEQLELQLSPDLTIQERADLQSALGVLVINNLLPASRVTLDNGKDVSVANMRKKGETVANTIRRGVVTIVGDAAVYQEMEDSAKSQKAASSDIAIRVLNLEELQKAYTQKIGSMATVFEFAAAKDDGQISLKPIVKKDDATIKNSDMPLAQGVKDYLNREGSRPWKFVGMTEKVAKAKEEAAKIVETKKSEGIKDFEYSYVDWFKDSILGTEAELIEKTATMNLESELAKFRSEELVIERMLMAHELVGDNKFYIGWDYTVSGRSMMSGKLINPQSSGISRFLVAADDMITNIDTATIDQKSLNHLELAIAQALDIGIDKTTAENGLVELHKKFVTLVKTDDGLKLEWGNNKKLKKLVEDPEFNIGNVRKLDEALAEVMEADPSAAKLEAGSKTILHLVQAVELLRDIQAGKTEISTNLALEADGITNGMAIVLMQMGWSEFTQDLLKKAGVYAKDDKFQNHGDYKDAGNEDIYESPIKEIENALGVELTSQVDELIGGKWRNFMKNPVMTFIYGAGLSNITKAVAESLIVGNSYIPGALALGKIDELLKFAGIDGVEAEYKRYEKDGTGRLTLVDISAKELKAMGADKAKQYAYLSDWKIAKLTRAINEKIKEPFANGFVKTFDEVIEFRQALKTVEQVNYTVFKMKFNEKVAALSKGKMGELTFDELGKIKLEMIKDGTYYSTDSAIEGGSIDYWKPGKSDTESDRISVSINTNDFQSTASYSRTYNKIIKELEANIGAIGVTTIHAVDGTIMIEGHVDAILNIYDAVMMGADYKKNEAQIQNMNKAFYDVNTRHSVLGKAVEKMEYMLKVLGDSKMTPELSVSTMRDLKRIHELKVDEGLNGVTEKVIKILDKIDVQRRTLADTELTINQYAAANDVDGVASGEVEVDKSGRYAVYGEDTDKAGIKAGLEWLVNGAEEIAQKEEVKAVSDKIPAEVITELENLFKSSDNSVKRIMRDTAKKMAGVDSNQFSIALKELTKDC